jgi:WD40 repeat protein
MIQASDWLALGLLRASVGLSLATLSVGAWVQLFRPRPPRCAQYLLTVNPRPPRWRRVAPIGVAIAIVAAPILRLQAVARSDVVTASSSDPTGSTEPQSPLPPRALIRIGTDALRIRSSFITGIMFSRDGRLIAAGEANAAVPRVSLFDVRTGRPVRVISPPGRPAGWVQCVVFAPDWTKLAWGEIGGHVAVWDLPGDRLLFREKLHENGVSDVAFSPNGEIVASGGEDAVVHLRRAGDPRSVVQRIATGERNPVHHRGFAGAHAGMLPVGPIRLAFTPDGSRLIVGSGSSATISVWCLKDGEQGRRIEAAFADPRARSASLSTVAAMPDGRRVIAAGECTVPIGHTKIKYGPRNVSLTQIGLWDLGTGERIADLTGEETQGRGYAALSRDGRHLVVGDSGVLRILDAATGRPERAISLPGHFGDRPAFSPDGTLVAMAIYNTIALFDVAIGRRLHHNAATPEGEFASGAWSPTGDRIVTGHSDGEVRMWDAATGKLIWHEVLAPVISPSGWNARPAFLGFSGDGQLLVAAGRRDDPVKYENGIVAVFEASSGRRLREAVHKEVRWAALGGDGRMVVAGTSSGGWGDTHLLGIDVAAVQTRWASPPESDRAGFGQLAGMQFRSGSPFLDVAIRDGSVIRFNGLTGREQRRFLAEWRPPEERQAARPRDLFVFTASFSADGRIMASSSNQWICVWDAEAGSLRRRIRFPNAHGCFLALSADGRTVATSEVMYAGDEGENTIRLYDTGSGELVLTLDPGDDRADVLAFSADGARLLAGFHRGTALVWDVSRGPGAPRAKE